MVTFIYLVSMFVIWAWLYRGYINKSTTYFDLSNAGAVFIGIFSLVPFINTIAATFLIIQGFVDTDWASKRFTKK